MNYPTNLFTYLAGGLGSVTLERIFATLVSKPGTEEQLPWQTGVHVFAAFFYTTDAIFNKTGHNHFVLNTW
jgi:hypothetical protein